jgi:flagellar L-ring protein precursor FlgH
MMRRIALISIVLVIALGASVAAESLWTDKSKSLVADRKAKQVGDILTIIVAESAASTNSASTDVAKKNSLSTAPGVGPLLQAIPAFGYSGDEATSASGSTSRTSNFVTKMTVSVTKVLENGNLEVQGTRDVQTNKETQKITLTGTVRQDDIASDNTILSTYVADAKIVHIGSGPIGSRMKEGLVTKIFKILF